MYQYTEFDRQFVHARAAQYRDQLQRRGCIADGKLRYHKPCGGFGGNNGEGR